MRQFTYISTAAALAESDIDAILESAQTRNPLNDITGFLLYNGRNFLQLIEGPRSALMTLMVRLAVDRRHSGIVRLEDHSITKRVCPEWTMHRIQLSESIDRRRDELDQALPPALDAVVRRTVLNFASLN